MRSRQIPQKRENQGGGGGGGSSTASVPNVAPEERTEPPVGSSSLQTLKKHKRQIKPKNTLRREAQQEGKNSPITLGRDPKG